MFHRKQVIHIAEPYTGSDFVTRCPGCGEALQRWFHRGPKFRKGLIWLKCWQCRCAHTRLPAHPSALEAKEPKRVRRY